MSAHEFTFMTAAFGLSGMGMGRVVGEIFVSRRNQPALTGALALLGAVAGALLVPAARAPAGTCYVLASSAYVVECHLAAHLDLVHSAAEAEDLKVVYRVGVPVILGSMCLWLVG